MERCSCSVSSIRWLRQICACLECMRARVVTSLKANPSIYSTGSHAFYLGGRTAESLSRARKAVRAVALLVTISSSRRERTRLRCV